MKWKRMQKIVSNGLVAKLGMLGLILVSLIAAAYLWLLPAYQVWQVQSKIEEVFGSADACRAVVDRAVKETTALSLSSSLFVCDGGAASGVKISKYLKSIAIGNAGTITVTFDYRTLPALTPFTHTLTLMPLVDGSKALSTGDINKTIVGWRCGNAKDGTTVPVPYLPSGCRG
jgi:type IV pilus assembly protein PilA